MSDQASPYSYYDPEPSLLLQKPICVIGFMGSDAHMVSALLSSLTGQPLIDLDAWIEHETGQSLSILYQRQGAGAWRTLELKGLKRALKSKRPSIIALGDGALLATEARELIKASAQLVYLQRPLPILYQGLLELRKKRPSRFPYWSKRAPQEISELEPLLNARLFAFEEADITLNLQNQPPLSVARMLVDRLKPVGRYLILSLLCLCIGMACDTLTIETTSPMAGVALATFDTQQEIDQDQPSNAGMEIPSAPVGGMSTPNHPPASTPTGGVAIMSDMGLSEPSAGDSNAMVSEHPFEMCVHEMDARLNASWTMFCSQYPMGERVAQGPYGEDNVVGVCLKLSCEGLIIEGHNGLMAARTCYDLDLLRQALSAAADDVNDEGDCVDPLYTLKVVPLNERVFGDPCDQISCQIEPGGLFVRGDN